jgi:hypothetical protein
LISHLQSAQRDGIFRDDSQQRASSVLNGEGRVVLHVGGRQLLIVLGVKVAAQRKDGAASGRHPQVGASRVKHGGKDLGRSSDSHRT